MTSEVIAIVLVQCHDAFFCCQRLLNCQDTSRAVEFYIPAQQIEIQRIRLERKNRYAFGAKTLEQYRVPTDVCTYVDDDVARVTAVSRRIKNAVSDGS